jgi:hypothetical protein
MNLFEQFEDRYGDERIPAKEAIRLCKFHGTDILQFHKESGYSPVLSDTYDWQVILFWLGY